MKTCDNCGNDKLERSFTNEETTCKKCKRKIERKRIKELDLFDTDWQRRVWRETFGEQKQVTTQGVMTMYDYAGFIPKKK